MNINKEQAFGIVEQALNVASLKGVFGLQDAGVVNAAIAVIRKELDIPLPEVPKVEGKPVEYDKEPTPVTKKK